MLPVCLSMLSMTPECFGVLTSSYMVLFGLKKGGTDLNI
jgi:hypothetical protein